MKLVSFLLLFAVLVPTALSMPVDEPPAGAAPNAGPVRIDAQGPGAELIRERLRMQEEYEEFVEKRRVAQEAAAATRRNPGRDGVAGWRTEAIDQTKIEDEVPVVPERESWETNILYVGGAGVLLILLLKVFRPGWLTLHRKPRPAKAHRRADGPMTVRLKPRPERMGSSRRQRF